MKKIVWGLAVFLIGFIFSPLESLAQSECVKVSLTTFHVQEGDCNIQNSTRKDLKTAKATVSNECDRTIWVSMDYDGEMFMPALRDLHPKKRIEPGERVDFKACNMPPNAGSWVIRSVFYEQVPIDTINIDTVSGFQSRSIKSKR